LELLDLLCQGPKNGETLARETGMSLANTSQHLQTLRAARLVEADKEGLHETERGRILIVNYSILFTFTSGPNYNS
jgi:DNA-binding transcriptional ArsR family regulator